MVSKVLTVSFQGVQARPVTVETHFSSGLPGMHIVGLPDKSVSESKVRIRACFHALNLALPGKHITVNLAPADQQKEGSHYDLPIATALLVACGVLPADEIESYVVLGELSLDGNLCAVSGVLPASVFASEQHKGVICPAYNGCEASWAGNLSILAPRNLIEIVNHFKGIQVLAQPLPKSYQVKKSYVDIAEVKGQAVAKRALKIAAAGGHNLLMMGPPGSGKSMLAKRIIGILPPLSAKEALETTMLYSLAGLLDATGLIVDRPFREPHHSSSLVALVGGGRRTKPGEISLAHNGVLFMDELPEFSRMAIEALRQPIESGEIIVARAENHILYPARFQLIAAMNPCRCGYCGIPEKQCHKAPNCGQEYQTRISGPILDRFDIVVHMSEVALKDLHQHESETSAMMQASIIAARQLQYGRWEKDLPEHMCINARLEGDNLKQQANLPSEVEEFLMHAGTRLGISARRHNRILRVARTIADLRLGDHVTKDDLLEALSFRM